MGDPDHKYEMHDRDRKHDKSDGNPRGNIGHSLEDTIHGTSPERGVSREGKWRKTFNEILSLKVRQTDRHSFSPHSGSSSPRRCNVSQRSFSKEQSWDYNHNRVSRSRESNISVEQITLTKCSVTTTAGGKDLAHQVRATIVRGRDPTHQGRATIVGGWDLSHQRIATRTGRRDPTHQGRATTVYGRDLTHRGIGATTMGERDPSHQKRATRVGGRDPTHRSIEATTLPHRLKR